MDTSKHEYTDVDEFIRQGQVLTGQGLFAQAEVYYNKALYLDPMNYIAYMSRGIMWANCGELEKAKSDFKRAINVNREIPDAYYHLGNIAFMQDDFDEGVAQFNTAIAKGYEDAELYFHFGIAYEEQQLYDTAICHYTRAIHMDPQNPDFRIRKVVAQTKNGQWEESLETLEGLHSIAPDSFDYYHLKSMVLITMNRLKDADMLLDEAVRRFPEDLDLLNDRISTLVALGNTDQALVYVNQIKNQLREDPPAYQKLLLSEGKLYGCREQTDRAVQCLNEAVSLDAVPVQTTEALYFLINIHHIEKRYNEMIAAAEKLLTFQDINAYALSGWYYKALAKMKRGDQDYKEYYQEIIRNYRTVALDEPARIDAYLYRAMAYKDIGEHARALEMMDYLTLLQPDNADIHAIKSIIYTAMGKEKEALAEKALAQNGSHLFQPD